MRYQKKPVVIEAWRTDRGVPYVPGETGVQIVELPSGEWAVYDELHDTHVKFEPGDWIIKGLKGEFYPCKPDVFEASYEPVQE